MKSKAARQALVWGGVLILVGALSLLNQFVELSAWVWVVLLVAGALLASGLYLTNRSDWAMLITAYSLWAIALLVALIMLDILRDEAIAAYSLVAVALPFLATFVRDRAKWWALITGGILAVVGLTFLIAEAAFVYIGALVLVLVGVGLLVRVFTRRESAGEVGPPDPDAPATTGPEVDEPPLE